jgi:antitoxin component of RelBE/YafQ-DinJ toxin-antitoxin module
MVDKSKLATVSVRVEEELNRKVDLVTELIGVNKSDFIRACFEKLATDNEVLLDNCNKVDEYLNFIRTELSALPSNLILVKNGSWADVSDFLILMLCDQLWKIPTIRDNWKDFCKRYGLILKAQKKDEESELLDLESLVFLSAEKSGLIAPEDISAILNQGFWINHIEADKISLIVAVKKSFEDHSARITIKDYLNQSEDKEKGPLRIVIDAKGKFRRSGDWLYYPVTTEPIAADEKKESESSEGGS